MTFLTPLFVYVLFSVVVSLILKYSFKRNKTIQKIKRYFIGLSIVFFIPLTIAYFIYVFGTAFDNHYDVKKGTLLWYATMDNSTITEFPILNPVSKIKFNSIGGDSPNIGTGWGIEYESKTDIETLTKQIVKYIENDGYEIKAVKETQFYWIGKNKKNKMNRLYSGSNEKGESLDLFIEKQSNKTNRIECTIVF